MPPSVAFNKMRLGGREKQKKESGWRSDRRLKQRIGLCEAVLPQFPASRTHFSNHSLGVFLASLKPTSVGSTRMLKAT